MSDVDTRRWVMNALDGIESAEPIPPNVKRFTWSYRRADIRKKIRLAGGDLSAFLHWPVMHEALYAGFTNDTAKELGMLDHTHERAAIDPLIGHGGERPNVKVSPSGASCTYIRQGLALQNVSDTFAKLSEIKSIFEFGAGFGALASVARRLGWQGEHTIFDFPELLLIQKWYHAQLGITENMRYITKNELEHGKEYDLFISICALDEAPIKIREAVLGAVKAKFYLIWYHRVYGGVDNEQWFHEYFRNAKVADMLDHNPNTYSGQRILYAWA